MSINVSSLIEYEYLRQKICEYFQKIQIHLKIFIIASTVDILKRAQQFSVIFSNILKKFVCLQNQFSSLNFEWFNKQ